MAKIKLLGIALCLGLFIQTVDCQTVFVSKNQFSSTFHRDSDCPLLNGPFTKLDSIKAEKRNLVKCPTCYGRPKIKKGPPILSSTMVWISKDKSIRIYHQEKDCRLIQPPASSLYFREVDIRYTACPECCTPAPVYKDIVGNYGLINIGFSRKTVVMLLGEGRMQSHSKTAENEFMTERFQFKGFVILITYLNGEVYSKQLIPD